MAMVTAPSILSSGLHFVKVMVYPLKSNQFPMFVRSPNERKFPFTSSGDFDF